MSRVATIGTLASPGTGRNVAPAVLRVSIDISAFSMNAPGRRWVTFEATALMAFSMSCRPLTGPAPQPSWAPTLERWTTRWMSFAAMALAATAPRWRW